MEKAYYLGYSILVCVLSAFLPVYLNFEIYIAWKVVLHLPAEILMS